MKALVLAISACALGCTLQADLVPCGDRLCPAGLLCVAETYCANQDQLNACTELGDGEPCMFATRSGVCDLGVCVATACGNATQDVGEACDDGNVTGGDGCSADCLKIELCGDAIADEGEGCDDGNANPADGCDACSADAWEPTATIGGSAQATATVIEAVSVAVDRDGNAFVGGWGRVMRVDRNGIITHVAGLGPQGVAYSGDGGPATSAGMSIVRAVAVDGLGNIYVAEDGTHRVRRIDPMGMITTIAGVGTAGFSGDGAVAKTAQLRNPSGVAVDGLGNILIADTGNHRVRRIDVAGVITTVAGTGTPGFAGDGGAATSALLTSPGALAVDASGKLWIIADSRVRRVDINGVITTVAGGGTVRTPDISATSFQLGPTGLAVDAAGDVYIAEGGISGRETVQRVDTNGIIHTFAGTGVYDFTGDGGPATSATFRFPDGVAVDEAGNVFIVDQRNNRLRRVDPAGVITTVAGNGLRFSSGDGGAATCVTLGAPAALALDSAGNLYLADMYQNRVRRIDARGQINTVAGTGDGGSTGDGGPATSATFYGMQGVVVTAQGTMFIADSYNCRIRQVDTTGMVSPVAGNESSCFSAGDGGPAVDATFDNPTGLALDAQGRLLIADTDGSRVRRIETNGTITTIAGTGTCDYTGDGGAATSATLCGPQALAVRGQELYIADRYNSVIRKVDAAGVITTVAGNGTDGFSGDGGPATGAQLYWPGGIAVDATGTLYIGDEVNHRVRRVSSSGTITTIAGTGVSGFAGDGGPATAAQLAQPLGVALDAQGRLYIASSDAERIRRLELDGTISTIAGPVDPEGSGPLGQARLTDPRAIAITPTMTLFAGGSSGRLQAADASDWLEVVAGRYPQAVAAGNRARYQSSAFGEIEGVAFDATTKTIYITETNKHRIHAIAATNLADRTTWTIGTYANVAGTAGFANGAVSAALFRRPTGLWIDEGARQLYVADTGNHVVRAIDLTTGIVRTIAGVAQQRGFFGDGGAATSALLFEPHAITRCSNGDLFIADTGNHRVRRLAAGTITTVLGVGVAASSGEGTPASSFPVNAPKGIACDVYGNLFATSTTSVRAVPANAMGVVDGSGPATTIYGSPPRSRFPESVTGCLTGIAAPTDGSVQVVDSCSGILVELRRAATQ